MPPPASPVQRQNRDVRVSLLGPKAVLSCSESGNPTLCYGNKHHCQEAGVCRGHPQVGAASFVLQRRPVCHHHHPARRALCSRGSDLKGDTFRPWARKPCLGREATSLSPQFACLGCDTKHRSLTPVQGVTSFRGFEPIIHNLRAILNDL